MRDALQLPPGYAPQTRQTYRAFHDVLCREYGVFSLVKDRAGQDNVQATVERFLLTTEVEMVLDLVELAFRHIAEASWSQYTHPELSADDAVGELNVRFREHGVGFQFEHGEIIRIDSQILHAEIVKPALALLSDKYFTGANDEFLAAYEHYRHGRHKEAMNEALKCLESTLKTICLRRRWTFESRDTAKRLIDVVFQHHLLPTHLQAHFAALRTSLEAGVPTIRNRESGHGQGSETITVPSQLVAYALHLTGAAVLFLVQSEHAFVEGAG